MKITDTLKIKTSQQKRALFQPDRWVFQLTSTSSRIDDMEIKDAAQNAEKERFVTEQCPALTKSPSTKCSIPKMNLF